MNSIREALDACAMALTPTRDPGELEAKTKALVAMRLQPYPATSLETAACLWEAVCEMEKYCANGEVTGKHVVPSQRADRIRACREAIGSSALRLTVLGWTDAVDAAWALVENTYDAPFDWEFVPGWIAANIDWSDPYRPQIALQAPEPAPEPDFPVTIDWLEIATRAASLVSNGWANDTIAHQLKAEFEHGKAPEPEKPGYDTADIVDELVAALGKSDTGVLGQTYHATKDYERTDTQIIELVDGYGHVWKVTVDKG